MFSMPDADLTVLARDIRILSALLNAADYYWWPSTPRVVESTDNRSFSHISTLLGIDTDMPVAVTGAITAENVTATIVCSRRGEPEQQLKLVESRSVGPSRRSLREILVDKKTPPGLEGYVADLIALFAAVRSKTISRTTIIEWIIYRGWSKLNTWMKRSETDFQGDLFDLVEAWSPDHDDDIPQRVVLMPNSSSVYDKYESIAIRTDGGGTTFVLNEDTASLLVKTIARIFRDIRQIIANPEVDRSQAAFSLVDSFVWLQVVLANKHVEILMTGTSLRFALVPKWPESMEDASSRRDCS
ncbi:hypothetical protein LXA43DRAFT_334046 [Ganoderma leucocontextum]|nr:hypothetical protein LXA43DRAFT_334046 [Ganoderma leucocontextum]